MTKLLFCAGETIGALDAREQQGHEKEKSRLSAWAK
jgi:hypothetical protein